MRPADVARHGELLILGDARLVLSEPALGELSAAGDAVGVHAVGDQPSAIPQHHATTPEELAEYVDAYRRLALRAGLELLLRGQTRDYYSGGGLVVLPAGFRADDGAFSRGLVKAEWVDAQLGPWLNCLSEICGIDLGTCLQFIPVVDEFGLCRWISTRAKHLTGSSLGIIALLQHYGLPTYFLDVTPRDSVAAWFALNRAKTADDGRVSFDPLPGVPAARRNDRRSPEDIADVPCVQVYLQARDNDNWPVLDLRTLPGLGEVALRPNRQEAFFLPFMATHVDGESNRVGDSQCYRSPTAVIKLYFSAGDLQRTRPELSADYLLPVADPLYGVLWNERVPKLTDLGPPAASGEAADWRTLVRQALPVPPENEPRPGSIAAESPNAPEAYRRVAALLRASSIPYGGSFTAVSGVGFYIKPDQELPAEVQTALYAISAELQVPIHVGPEEEDDF